MRGLGPRDLDSGIYIYICIDAHTHLSRDITPKLET